MISPLAFVDPSAKIGENVTIHPFAFVDADTVIGDGCTIMPYASIIRGTTLGKEVKVYQGAIVGADPQDFRWKGHKTFCSIGDNTIIREHVIINRSIIDGEATVIGSGCFIFANSHIGHDSHLLKNIVVGNNTTIAGGVNIDEGTILSSSVTIHEDCNIGKYVLIKGGRHKQAVMSTVSNPLNFLFIVISPISKPPGKPIRNPLQSLFRKRQRHFLYGFTIARIYYDFKGANTLQILRFSDFFCLDCI